MMCLSFASSPSPGTCGPGFCSLGIGEFVPHPTAPLPHRPVIMHSCMYSTSPSPPPTKGPASEYPPMLSTNPNQVCHWTWFLATTASSPSTSIIPGGVLLPSQSVPSATGTGAFPWPLPPRKMPTSNGSCLPT